MEQEAFFSDSDLRNKELFPDHLAVLLSKDADSTEMSGSVEWQGVLHAMKADMTAKISAVETKIKTMQVDMDAKISSVEGNINTAMEEKISAVDAKISAVDVKINALDQKLDLILSRFS